MGSPIFPVIVNVFIEHFEKEKNIKKNQKFDYVM